MCLHDDRIRAPIDERLGLFLKRLRHLLSREITIGLHQPAEGPHVAQHISLPPHIPKRLADDFDGRLVDLCHIIRIAVAIEHDPRTTERVGDDAVRTRLGVSLLDRQHLFRMAEVPLLAAVALLQAREHKLRAHRPIADQRP